MVLADIYIVNEFFIQVVIQTTVDNVVAVTVRR